MSHWTALQFAMPSDSKIPAEIAALAQPFPARRSYRVLASAPLELTDADGPGVDREVHLLDVMQPDPRDRSCDSLIIDGVELPRADWSWSVDGTVLRWCHGSGTEHSAGELVFDGVGHRAVGSVALDGDELAVVAVSAMARFSCRLLHDERAAYRVSGALTWVKNETWNEPARWSGAGLVWSFWLEEYVDDFGDRAYRPRVGFEDTQTGVRWEPAAGSYHASMDGARRYHFELKRELGAPPHDDRSGLADPRDRSIRTVFPVHLVLQLDASATRVEGAIEVLLPDRTTQVYAVAGEFDGPVAMATVAARRSGAEAMATAAPLAVQYLQNLDPYDHVKVGESETVRDAVQFEVEKSFAQIVQYYMPVELRRKFISAAPPSLPAEVRAIAETRVAGNDPAGFYRSLARPFVTLCLGNRSAKLNSRRARKLFDERLAHSPVYREHAVKLYRHHFLARFKDLPRYLADETQDVPEKHQKIEQYAKSKREEYQDILDKVGDDPPLREQYQKLLDGVEQGRQKALDGRFWAFRLYHHFTSAQFLTAIETQMSTSADGKGVQAAIRNIQRASTILSVLDDSQHFAAQFAEHMRVYQMSLIIRYANLAQDEKLLRDVVNEIAGRFVEEHAHESDELTQLLVEQMKASVADRKSGMPNAWLAALKIVLELLFQEGNVKDINRMFRLIAERLEPITERINGVIAKIPKVGERLVKAGTTVQRLSSKLTSVALAIAHAASVVTITATLAGGWESFDDLNRGMLITIGVGLVANSALSILAKGQNFLTVVFLAGDGYRGALRWAMGQKVTTLWGTVVDGKLIEDTWKGLLQGQLERSSGGKIRLARWSQLKGVRGAAARFASRLLANLPRILMGFIAALVAVGQIFWSAWELHHAKTPLEKASHGLLMAASLLELGGLLFQGLAILAGTGAAAAAFGVIAGVFAGLALLVAVAGIAIMIYLVVTATPSDPVEEFASTEAKEDDLYMPLETAIEDVLPVYDESRRLVREGVSLAATPPVGGGPARYLTIGADGQLSAGELTHDQRTCFGLIADAKGRAQIYAATLSESGEQATRYLTLGEGGKLETEAELLEGAGAHRQRWCTELVSARKNERNQPESWSFHLHVVNDQGARSYLRYDGGRFSSGAQPQPIELRLESTRPAGLAMDDILLTAGSRDQRFFAYLAMGGSEPRTWGLEGELPAFLELDRASGAVMQKPGHAPVISTTGPLHVTVRSEAHRESTLRSNPFRVVVTAA